MCTCGCSSSDDSDSVDTLVCNKNYRTYMCKSVCSSGSDSDVTDVNDSSLEYKLYQSVLQTFGRDPTYNYMPDIETEDPYCNAKEEQYMRLVKVQLVIFKTVYTYTLWMLI